MKSPKEISVDQKLIALTTEIIELTEDKDQLPLLVVKELIEDAEIGVIFSTFLVVDKTSEEFLILSEELSTLEDFISLLAKSSLTST